MTLQVQTPIPVSDYADHEPAAVGDALDMAIAEARAGLADLQHKDGHWAFPLEADATISAEYILLEHFLGTIDEAVQKKLANYLRAIQGAHGGWPLFHAGDFNISASVKAYFALKLIGDDVEAPHMARARKAILAAGGAAQSNVFTRITLALFEQVPWRAVPVMPLQMMILPRWFPFHLDKVSYWSRTVIVPLLILMTFKPQANNPRKVDIRELFTTPPEAEHHYMHSATKAPLGYIFLALDRALRWVEPYLGGRSRAKALRLALDFMIERLNDEDGLGGIFPAMANAVMAFHTLGHSPDDPNFAVAMKSVRKMLVLDGDKGYCQPCLSPVWDTCLTIHAMLEADDGRSNEEVAKAGDWLVERQILDVVGDWAATRPELRPGGWAFQYWNDHYPDVDDSAVILMALERIGDPRHGEAIERGVEWIIGMQSENGGWGAFAADNTAFYLNHIPFADHGALLDPPTEDVTARCVGMLLQLGYDRDHPAVARGLAFLYKTQQPDGSWHGRWGTNYVYGTWSVLSALNAAGDDPQAPHMRRAVEWLLARQREDGGWGEDGASYWAERKTECKASTPSQTAWALLGLMAAGEVHSEAARRGVEYLLEAPREGCDWKEEFYTAVGFPRVFYLRYHGYRAFFPLWALARYRNLSRGTDPIVAYGI